MSTVSAVWENAGPEIFVISTVFLLGVAWGAFGAHVLGDPRRGWE